MVSKKSVKFLSYLKYSSNSGDYDMIEADIVLGKLFNNGPVMPIMAHPPLTSSDLSLDSFLLQIKLFNLNNPIKMKGIKLDFKSIDVFEGALDTLKTAIPEVDRYFSIA